jgi:hypothetical protein
MREIAIISFNKDRVNPWPCDKHEKELGLSLRLESISTALMTRHLGKSEEEMREILKCVELTYGIFEAGNQIRVSRNRVTT